MYSYQINRVILGFVVCWGGATNLRGGSLSHDKVIDLVKAFFVPVYISHEKGDAPDADKKQWHRIYREAKEIRDRPAVWIIYNPAKWFFIKWRMYL